VFYQEDDGTVPLLEWLDHLPGALHVPTGAFVMPAKKKFTSNALQYAYHRYIGANPEQVAAYEEELANAELAQKIYDLRTKAGLTQRQLAKLVGTTASVICRLEDADYEGHSLAMLRRIAAALGKRVEIRFLPAKRRRKPA
jgi:DNA-binding XRE family transcriptional regulator